MPYYVYIMSSRSKTLYTGVTNDLYRRVFEHENELTPGFTTRHKIDCLVFMEEAARIEDAIAWEKQIKKWTRRKKLDLIEKENPEWLDLSEGWFQ